MTDHDKHSAGDDEFKLDFSKFKRIFSNKKVNRILLLTLLLIIPIILTIYIRALPQELPATDSWAQNSVYNYYKNSIAQQVSAQYPNLPATQKQKLVDEQFNQFLATNKNDLDANIAQTSQFFKKGFQYTENNVTYTFLGDLDSYSFLRQARNIEEKGMACDEIRNGVCIDNHMYAPLGLEVSPDGGMHVQAIVFLHKVMHFFNKKVNLMTAQFYLPMVLAVIATIAVFFIGKRLMNEVAGFFAAMFLALSPLFITRTLGADTDIWNIMFPLIILWLVIEAFEAKSMWKRIVIASAAGLATGAFTYAWSGWWYIFDFIMFAVVAYIIFEMIKGYIKHKHLSKNILLDIKNVILVFGVFMLSSLIFVSLISGFGTFVSAFTSPLGLSNSLKIAAHADLWPNVYTTVAELNEAGIGTIISQLSFNMPILFSLALLGVIFMMVGRKPTLKEYILIVVAAIVAIYLSSTNGSNLKLFTYMFVLAIPLIIALVMLLFEKESVVDVKMALLFTVWFLGMTYASTKGVRFILLLIPAFSIAIGVAIGYIYQYLSRTFHEDIKINEVLSKLIVFVVLCLILITPVKIGIAAGESFVPSVTAGWYDSLTKIKNESKPDAIINSWWDFGHWFKYFADRAVTLDGATQNHPNAHWLGLALQTNDTKRSVAILRMLDCGSNNAFEEINKKWNDTEISENIVSELISLDKANAKEYLSDKGYTDVEVNKILKYTHCTPPEDYFITSEDMVGKAGVWAHFGLWSFDKAFIVTDVKPLPLAQGVALMKSRWNYTDEEATKAYYDVQALTTDSEMNSWIAPWPSYGSSSMISCQIGKDSIVYCDLNMLIQSNGQQNVYIERTAINTSNPQKAQILIGVYDAKTNSKLGESVGSWGQVIMMDETGAEKKYTPTNITVNMGFLLNKNVVGNTTTYNALVADPLLIDSTFTKLFYLDGKGAEHFEKFSDVTDITGTRIIVWKVNWDEE